MTVPRLKNLVVALALAGVAPALLSMPLHAAAVQEQVSVKPQKRLSPREEAIISQAGAKVLRHIAEARSEIRDKDADAARSELDKADRLLDIIHEALPTSTVKDRIWVAKKHLEYEDTQQVLPDLIPIYSSLDELMDVMPVKPARAHLDKARAQLQAGDKAGARKALEETDASLQYTEIDLPLGTTRDLVGQARTEIGKRRFDDADKTLKAAEDSVVFISVGIEQPLFAAKAALTQSVVDVDAGNIDLATIDLDNAIADLKSAQQSPDKATREAAADLLGQAQQLRADLKGGGDFSVRFHRLLERTQAYADRAVEYLDTGWQRFRSEDHPFRSDLIEARLHLANARIDMFTGHEADGAKNELATAGRYLGQAQQAAAKQPADADYGKRIDTLQQSVASLQADPGSGGPDHYQVLQRQLDAMIETL